MFGATHAPVYWGLYAIFFALAAIGKKFLVSPSSERARPDFGFSTIVSVFIGYLIFQGIVFGLWPVSHPIVGTSSWISNWDKYITALLSIGAFVAATIYFKSLFGRHHSARSFAQTLIPISLLLISLIALAHWLSDNGKLFWFFQPETIIYSERARWPFVNSNSLAQFLMLLIFPTLALFLTFADEMTRLIVQVAHRRAVRIGDLLQLPRIQTLLFRIGVCGVSFLAGMLALLAAQSRACWIGATFGIAVFLFGWHRYIKKWITPLPTSLTIRQKTPLLSYIVAIRRALPIITAVGIAVLLFMFLEGHGKDLVVDRLNYGFLAAMDDLRWQIYKDTLPMIWHNLLFGVGLGGWDLAFGSYASAEMGNLNPVYAHSDPLQLLAETGFIGFGLVLLAVRAVYKQGLNMCSNASDVRHAILSLGLLSSFTGILVACCFDFPFRIPAIVLLTSMILGMLQTSTLQNEV